MRCGIRPDTLSALSSVAPGPPSMPPVLARYITDFGDSSLTMPLAAGLALLLWRAESARAALAVLRALAVCLVLTVTLKLMFMSCGGVWQAGMRSPSGHAGVSLTVYGTLGIVAGIRAPDAWRRPLVAVLGSLVLGIALTRLVIGAHNLAEVLTGLLIGKLALLNFLLCYRPLPQWKVSRRTLIGSGITALLCLALLHGQHWPGEGQLWQLVKAYRLRSYCLP